MTGLAGLAKSSASGNCATSSASRLMPTPQAMPFAARRLKLVRRSDAQTPALVSASLQTIAATSAATSGATSPFRKRPACRRLQRRAHSRGDERRSASPLRDRFAFRFGLKRSADRNHLGQGGANPAEGAMGRDGPRSRAEDRAAAPGLYRRRPTPLHASGIAPQTNPTRRRRQRSYLAAGICRS